MTFSLYKPAAFLLLLFFVGHTFGGMLAEVSWGPASDEVFTAMQQVQFDFHGRSATWHDFWFGFGSMVSVYLLLCAFVVWTLDRTAPAQFRAVAPIAWALVVTKTAIAVLGLRYFFAGPATFSSLVAALVGVETWRRSRAVA
jgi:hypothetical protein